MTSVRHRPNLCICRDYVPARTRTRPRSDQIMLFSTKCSRNNDRLRKEGLRVIWLTDDPPAAQGMRKMMTSRYTTVSPLLTTSRQSGCLAVRLPRSPVTSQSGYLTVRLPRSPVTSRYGYLTVRLPHSPVASQSGYLTVRLPHSPVTSQSGYLTVRLPHSPVTSQSGYLTVRLPHSPVTSQSGYLTVRLPHSPVTSQYGYLTIWCKIARNESTLHITAHIH